MLDRIMNSGKTNVTSNAVLAGHVENFKSQMTEVAIMTIMPSQYFMLDLHHHQVVNIQEDLAGYRAALEQVEINLRHCNHCQCHQNLHHCAF